jgi:ADP-heptose:LPS heptosyltransferase
MSHDKILVIRDGRLGDLLMITPVLRALRAQWPDAELHVLTGGYGARVLQNNRWVHTVHEFDRQRGLFDQARALRALPGPFDLVLVLESSSRFSQVARTISARRRVGFANRVAWLYDDHLMWDPDIHAVRNNLLLAQRAGVAPEHVTLELELDLGPDDLELADLYLKGEGLAEGESYVFMHPPCGPEDPLRPWPNFYFAELADRIHRQLGMRVLINGSPEEAHIVDSVVAQASTPVLTNTDPSLGLMMGLIARSALFVGGNTGTLHMASALGRPLIALFGNYDPADCGPVGPSEHETVISAGFPCSPCVFSNSAEKTKCLEQGMADCMIAISVDQVFEAAELHLAAC